MNRHAIPEVLPVAEQAVLEVLPAPRRQRRSRPGLWRRFTRLLTAFVGWSWRWAVGTVLCFNFYLISYLTCIVVVGWSYRWVQALVFKGWWNQSSRSEEGTFADFCAELGPELVTPRPRWFWQENIRDYLGQPRPDGKPAGALRVALRVFRVPLASFWLNFKIGLKGLLGTYLITGPGCLLMLFSWEFGWLNSFNKGYEQAPIGPLVGFLGIGLFIASLFYVPLAQVHHAATGELAAFFDFRFIWRIIRATPIGSIMLAAVLALGGLIVEIMRIAPVGFDDHQDFWTNLSDQELLANLSRYFLICSAFFFPMWLFSRWLAARCYRGAVLKVVRRGWHPKGELHPKLARWLDVLELDVTPAPDADPSAARGFTLGGWIACGLDLVVGLIFFIALVAPGVPKPITIILPIWLFVWLVLSPFWLLRPQGFERFRRFLGRRFVFSSIFWIWFLFISKTYVGEFFNYNPLAGFANHPMIQMPCLDFIPTSLVQAASAGGH